MKREFSYRRFQTITNAEALKQTVLANSETLLCTPDYRVHYTFARDRDGNITYIVATDSDVAYRQIDPDEFNFGDILPAILLRSIQHETPN
jgi:hypothetical protein